MIQVHAVSKKFEDFVALDKVSCQIEEGCIYGMVGSNGAGKSTFLRVLAGIYRTDEGVVNYDGKEVYENSSVKENIVYVGDELFFLAGANMERMAKLYASVYERFDYERFKYLVSVFGLDSKKSIQGFSKGMKRQVATILALSTKAKYMFFDETFDGLDPVMRNLVKKCICSDVLEYHTTAIITSHSLRELEDICDHLALLHRGGMVLDSDVIDLKTARFKVQIGFREEFNEELFEGMQIARFKKQGSVASMIVNGDREETVAKLEQLHPALLDVLPLSLEEIFTYEMEALGYAFDEIDWTAERGMDS